MFLRLTSDEPRTRPYQAGKTRQHPVTVHLIRPDELGPAEIATWHSMQGATPPLADPFLSPEFARAVGRVQPDTHVAVLAERETTKGKRLKSVASIETQPCLGLAYFSA